MAIRPRFRTMPTTSIELERVLAGAEVSADNGSVTDNSFADRAAHSVIGRSVNTSGKPADIGIAVGQFLGHRAGVIGGFSLIDSDIPASIARDSEVTGAIATATSSITAAYIAADAAHVAASDPHPQYLTAAEGNAAYQPLAPVLSRLYTGTGSPESVVTAPVGSLYLRQDGAANTTLYVKESGTGNTGWIAK
jgi:hypothetical protein